MVTVPFPTVQLAGRKKEAVRAGGLRASNPRRGVTISHERDPRVTGATAERTYAMSAITLAATEDGGTIRAVYRTRTRAARRERASEEERKARGVLQFPRISPASLCTRAYGSIRTRARIPCPVRFDRATRIGSCLCYADRSHELGEYFLRFLLSHDSRAGYTNTKKSFFIFILRGKFVDEKFTQLCYIQFFISSRIVRVFQDTDDAIVRNEVSFFARIKINRRTKVISPRNVTLLDMFFFFFFQCLS